MHRGTIFVITKDNNDKFKVRKSIEFNGGMGMNCYGKVAYKMLKKLEDASLFDEMIREFDNECFEYRDSIMTYFADEEKQPFIDEKGREFYEYAQTNNQFKFFRDDNNRAIYTSDSNYIKNLSNEDINIVCCNGNYVLKPNQILIADYSECINNSRISFGEKIIDEIQIDNLESSEYILTRKEKIILDNIIKTLESFDFKVKVLSENGMYNGIEIETWTKGGVNMIHSFYFWDYNDLYDKDNVKKKLREIYENFSIDDEIDIYRQDKLYKKQFSISESLKDFTEYKNRLENLSKKFASKYHENLYQKFINSEMELEMEM